MHVFDPARYPYAAGRRYTPPSATVDDLVAMHRKLGIERAVLVQPSVYGTDNRCLVAALQRLRGRARGIAVIGASDDRTRLQQLHASGVRGVRLNLQVAHQRDTLAIRHRILHLSEQLSDLPWLIQLYAGLEVIAGVADTLAGLPQCVLIDHFGMARASAGVEQNGFRELLALAARPNVHVKLSGPYQISTRGPHYCDVAAIAHSLFEVAPDRTVWGSDWPHPGGSQRPADADPLAIEPFRQEDDRRTLGLLGEWLPAVGSRRRVLVDNPARLFGFDD
ncbi:amidohydrolase family protein [Piscinibacter sakaiensis]|uniref:amidohydrolase family protein n=1 Tax=Piscinibacter sakaiensis TaxID=1547922 RepID=UPI003AB0EB7D